MLHRENEELTIFFKHEEGVYSTVFNTSDEVRKEWLKYPGKMLFTIYPNGEIKKVEKRVLRIVAGLGTASRWETVDATALYNPASLDFGLNEQAAVPDPHDPMKEKMQPGLSNNEGGKPHEAVLRIKRMFTYMDGETIDR